MHGRSAMRFYQMPWLLEGRRNRKWKGQELSADQKLPKLTMHSLLFHRISQSLAYIHTIQYPLQSAVTLHASLQNFSLFGPNISISRPASSTTSDKKKKEKKAENRICSTRQWARSARVQWALLSDRAFVIWVAQQLGKEEGSLTCCGILEMCKMLQGLLGNIQLPRISNFQKDSKPGKSDFS